MAFNQDFGRKTPLDTEETEIHKKAQIANRFKTMTQKLEVESKEKMNLEMKKGLRTKKYV